MSFLKSRRSAALGVAAMAAAAALLVPTTADAAVTRSVVPHSPAAGDQELDCATTGASGDVIGDDWHPGITDLPVYFGVADTLADGHHVQVRIVGRPQAGNFEITWPWHSVTTGAGTNMSWTSTASYSDGLYDFGVQVGRFEGSDMLNSCTKWLSDAT